MSSGEDEQSPDPTPRYSSPSSQPQESNKDVAVSIKDTANEIDEIGKLFIGDIHLVAISDITI